MSTWFFYNWNFQQVPVYENIMNAVCNPFFNNYLCDYDGGDCCTPFVDLDACGLASNCMCHFTGKTHATFEQVRFPYCFEIWPPGGRLHFSISGPVPVYFQSQMRSLKISRFLVLFWSILGTNY